MNENDKKGLQETESEDKGIVVTVKDKDGGEYDVTLLTVFQAGRLKRDYCAVLSHVPDGEGQFPVQIFRYTLTEQDGVEGMRISNITSDMEFEEAKEILMTLIDEN